LWSQAFSGNIFEKRFGKTQVITAGRHDPYTDAR
jgi:hypothetical protein